VKRRDLVQKIEQMGCFSFDMGETRLVPDPSTRMAQPVPRHPEIKEFLAKAILKKLS
jgi:mRNA interferase HicA